MSQIDQTTDTLIIIGAVIVILSTVAGYLWGTMVNTQGASGLPAMGEEIGFVIGLIIAISLFGISVAVRRQR